MNVPLTRDAAAPRVLIVDDTPGNLQVLAAILRPEGYRLSAAGSGSDALVAVAKAAPDLILMDVNMPGMDGFEACARLRADPTTAPIPVVFLTAQNDLEHLVRGFEAGGVDYLSKPFRTEELLARVRTHIELKRARDRLKLLSEQLGRYLSPPVYAALFRGERSAEITARSRDITVFFADIVSFTPRSEAMDPEALAAWLNNYLATMASVISRHGGTLDKFIGDAVMGFFGDPDSAGLSSDALACVHMAVEMRSRARDLGVQVRIGIASGPCTVGNFGSDQNMSYTAVGRVVNLASRLEGAAQAGQIVLASGTWERVRDHVHCSEGGLLRLKGIAQPEATFVVEEPSATADGDPVSFDTVT
ncbi:MAG: response regulator [Deltaproteobacteria bacterium]|nr:response regulator [Deltaproteobacteria bacterium]